jgi:hypothetical protein
MRLPNVDEARVPQAKIADYLLSFEHEDGRSKADFFTRFGFSATEWSVMAVALKEHAKAHQVKRAEDSPFGKRYVIEGIIEAPDGRTPLIRSIWFVGHSDTSPQFVTAYPLRRKIL